MRNVWRSHSDINPDGFAIYRWCDISDNAICALRHEIIRIYIILNISNFVLQNISNKLACISIIYKSLAEVRLWTLSLIS